MKKKNNSYWMNTLEPIVIISTYMTMCLNVAEEHLVEVTEEGPILVPHLLIDCNGLIDANQPAVKLM